MENKSYVIISSDMSEKLFKFLVKLPYETVQGLIPSLVRDIDNTKREVYAAKIVPVNGPETEDTESVS